MKPLSFFTFILLCSIHCLGQADSTIAAPATDSLKKKSTFTLGAVYAANANYYGQKAEEKIPYGALAATYHHRSGIYFSGLAYKLLNDTGSMLSAAGAGMGVDFKLSKKLSADISYSHTFYPSYSPFLQASNPDNATASLVYDNWLSSKISADYAFGKTTDVFVTAGTGKQVKLGSITRKDEIAITPSIDITGGTQRFYQTYLTEKRLRDSVLGILLTPVLGNPPSGSSNSKTTSSTEFNIISYNLKCPLTYSRASYLVELDYQLSLLSNKAQSNAGKLNSFFSASFYYQF